MDIADQLVGNLELLSGFKKFILPQGGHPGNFPVYFSHVPHCLDDVARSRLSLGANHGRTFIHAAQGFAQIFGTADKGHFELALIDMVDIIGRGEHFAFIDVVDFNGF